MTSDNFFNVAVGINYYDDPKGLIKILTEKTTYDYIYKFYIIDGKYKGREDLPENDTSFVRELCEMYPKIHLVEMQDATQIEKRNTYWDLAEADDVDFMIVLDSDEYMKINPDIFECSLRTTLARDAKCYPVKQHQQDIFTSSRPRLFKSPFTFRHRENRNGNGISHGSLYENYGESDKEIIQQMYAWFMDHPKREKDSDNQTGLAGIEMWHDKGFRSKERVIADRVYYDNTPNR